MICCIFNVGPHYRLPIYQKMAESFDVEFYFGDKAGTNIKTFNYSDLKGYKRTLKRVGIFGNWYWMSGVCGLAFKKYDTYIVTGEPFCVSVWIFLILAKLQRKTTIAWTHGWYGRETGIKKVIKKTFFRLFSKTMCYNDYSRNLMIKQGFDEKRVFTIGNSLNTDVQRRIRENLKASDIFTAHFGNNYPVILYCGRIQKVKRLEKLIEMLSTMNNRGINANMVFVGKDVDGVGIEEMAKNNGLENRVWFFGPCYDEEKLGELFYNSAVCVSPGNVGLTAIHALSYGCPVVTHDDFPNQMPEFEAITPDVTGSFFKNGSDEDLLRCTLRWLNCAHGEREETRKKAFAEIDRKWNIYSQIEVLKRVLR